MHVVESLYVFADQCDPVEPHFDLSLPLGWLQIIELKRYLFGLLQEILHEDALMLLLDDTLEVHIDEEIASFIRHDCIT